MYQNRKSGNYRAWIVVVISVAIFVPNFGQYLLSPIAESIMSEFNITSSQFSTLFTAPMIPAIFLSFVAGILVDRFNSRLVVGTAISISTAGAMFSIFAKSYPFLVMSFAMIGVSATVLNSTQAKLLSGWYPPEKVSSKTGIVLSSSTIAMAIALATAALFPTRRIAFTLTAVLSLFALILWILFYRTPTFNEISDGKREGGIESVKVVIQNKYIWVIAFCLFFMMSANVIMSSFMPTMFQIRGIAKKIAGFYSSVFMIGCFLSCYITPWIARKWKNVKGTVLLFSLIATIGVAFAVPYTPEGILLGSAILMTGVGIGGIIPLLMSMPVTLKGIGGKNAGTAGGLVATIQLLGAILVPRYILIPFAGEGNYITLFLLGGLCMLVCGLLALFLPSRSS